MSLSVAGFREDEADKEQSKTKQAIGSHRLDSAS